MDILNDRLMFNIVLYQPEIPANTGNIGRLCVGCDSALHIIKPMRFFITDKLLKRAGLDYWDKLSLNICEDIDEIYEKYPNQRIFLCSTKGENSYSDIEYARGDVFIFGPETKGLPDPLLEKNRSQVVRIPMSEQIRSINLANSVAVILYEACRQVWLTEKINNDNNFTLKGEEL